MDPDLVIPIAGMVTGLVLGLPLIRAAVRFIERKSAGGADPKVQAELEELRTRLEAVDELRDRLFELEERIDFTERVLTQQKEPPKLVEGG